MGIGAFQEGHGRSQHHAGTKVPVSLRHCPGREFIRSPERGCPIKSPDKKPGLNMPGGNMRYVSTTTGAFLPPTAWRYV
jgi:hypothetical protein